MVAIGHGTEWLKVRVGQARSLASDLSPIRNPECVTPQCAHMSRCSQFSARERTTTFLREPSIGRVRPKVMTALTAILGLLPLLVLNMHGMEIERPLAIVMIGGLVTSTLFTLLALPTFSSSCMT